MQESDQKLIGLSIDEVKKICRGIAGDDYTGQMLCRVEEELRQGFALAKRHPHMVTILGSARTKENDIYYQQARALGRALVEELSVAVATGGGPGIMEAANQGAKEAGGHSLGMTIKLPTEQHTNPYVTEAMDFQYFFTRKVVMTYTAKTFIYFPGGFGTLNEFFEILTLVQTKKISPVPMILFGSEYWQPLQTYIHNYLEERSTIDMGDMDLFYRITDDIDDVINTIRSFDKNE